MIKQDSIALTKMKTVFSEYIRVMRAVGKKPVALYVPQDKLKTLKGLTEFDGLPIKIIDRYGDHVNGK